MTDADLIKEARARADQLRDNLAEADPDADLLDRLASALEAHPTDEWEYLVAEEKPGPRSLMRFHSDRSAAERFKLQRERMGHDGHRIWKRLKPGPWIEVEA